MLPAIVQRKRRPSVKIIYAGFGLLILTAMGDRIFRHSLPTQLVYRATVGLLLLGLGLCLFVAGKNLTRYWKAE